MEHLNHLDSVWASLSTADRIVLLGHDRPYLDQRDKARLSRIADAKAGRGARTRPVEAINGPRAAKGDTASRSRRSRADRAPV